MQKQKAAEPETKIELSTRGVRASLPTVQASAIGQRIGDLLSPLTESGGLIGDYIRFFRQRAAILALKRVHDTARRHQVQLQVTPLKFLAPWLEAVSLEEDDRLIDLWAQLLLDASKNPKNANPVFIDVLKKVNGSQAKELEVLWKKWQKAKLSPGMADITRQTISWQLESVIESIVKKSKKILDEKRVEFFSRKFDQALTRELDSKGYSYKYFDFHLEGAFSCTVEMESASIAAATFRHLQLLDEDELEFDLREKLNTRVRVRFYCLSSFGMHFLSSCHAVGKTN